MLAAVLDFYHVRWEYEPTTFTLAEAPDGSPLWAFTPDFFLPDYGVYLELTTMRQTLVTKDRPVDAVIMAIVDAVEIGGEPKYDKSQEG